MRVTGRLLVLGTMLILLSGSLVSTNQSVAVAPSWQTAVDVERFLAEQDVALEDYRLSLQQAGEEIFAEKRGELRRAQMQQLHSEAKTLQAQKEEQIKEVQTELADELLRQQLQLMLVSLDKDQREARFEVITQLQKEFTSIQTDLETELQEELHELEAAHEEGSQEEVAILRAEVERAMDEELTSYRLALMKELEEEIAKLDTPSRSALANR